LASSAFHRRFRSLFCLSRSVGIQAHAYEQSLRNDRDEGPSPRSFLWTYDGLTPRSLPEHPQDDDRVG
jgi:citrate synthase